MTISNSIRAKKYNPIMGCKKYNPIMDLEG